AFSTLKRKATGEPSLPAASTAFAETTCLPSLKDQDDDGAQGLKAALSVLQRKVELGSLEARPKASLTDFFLVFTTAFGCLVNLATGPVVSIVNTVVALLER